MIYFFISNQINPAEVKKKWLMNKVPTRSNKHLYSKEISLNMITFTPNFCPPDSTLVDMNLFCDFVVLWGKK